MKETTKIKERAFLEDSRFASESLMKRDYNVQMIRFASGEKQLRRQTRNKKGKEGKDSLTVAKKRRYF